MSKIDTIMNENEFIVRSVKRIIRDINLEYRMSKLPKFIKKARYDAHMSKLKKNVENIKNIRVVDFNLLLDFINNMLNEDNTSDYDIKGCKQYDIHGDSYRLEATFIFPVYQEKDKCISKIAVSFITNDGKFDMLIGIHKDGIIRRKFSVADVNKIEITNHYETEHYYTDNDLNNDKILIDIITSGVIDNIYRYLSNIIAISERILDDE